MTSRPGPFVLFLILAWLDAAVAVLALPRFYEPADSDAAQMRLLPGVPGNPDAAAAVANKAVGRHTVLQQNDSLCDAGTRQWTGTVSLGAGRDMFFWYYESRSDPAADPLLLWLNGGPGASSMIGGLYEIGPCIVNNDAQSTRRNAHSWANAANLLVIDQPIGVGLSYTHDPSLWAESLKDAGIDLDKFLDGFFDIFPDLDDGRPVHFAGESFGGKYVPHYADMTRRRFDSIVLVDPYIDPALTSLGLYEHMCRRAAPSGHPRFLNETICEAMEHGYLTCETFGDLCRTTYDARVCQQAISACQLSIDMWWDIKDGDPDPYDDRRNCTWQEEPPVCGGMGMDIVTDFLNVPRVKGALGMAHINYTIVNAPLNARWSEQPDTTVPSSREIAHLLDVKETRVLVLNGNNDVSVSTETTIKVLDKLKWSGHARFLQETLQPWLYFNGSSLVRGGETKSQGALTLVTVDDAGHQSPENQREATVQVFNKWIRHESLV